jgi:RNA polymerase sigma factor (sigma-70 family)
MTIDELTDQFNQKYNQLHNYAYNKCRDKNVVDDVLQDTWFALRRTHEKGKEIDSVFAWCTGIINNLLLKYWRNQRKEKLFVSMNKHDIQDYYTEDINKYEVIKKEALKKCIASLPNESKRLIALKYDENLPYEEIAKIKGKNASSIKMVYYRLRKQMYKKICELIEND